MVREDAVNLRALLANSIKAKRHVTYPHMCDCPEDETGGRSDQAIGAVPKSNPCRLLLPLPPGRRDQDEAGVKTGLEYTKEEASRSKSAESRGRASSRKCGTYMMVRLRRILYDKNRRTPKNKVDGKILSDWVSLHEEVGRILGDKVADVEDADQ